MRSHRTVFVFSRQILCPHHPCELLYVTLEHAFVQWIRQVLFFRHTTDVALQNVVQLFIIICVHSVSYYYYFLVFLYRRLRLHNNYTNIDIIILLTFIILSCVHHLYGEKKIIINVIPTSVIVITKSQ